MLSLFVWAPDDEGNWTPESTSRWWLHQFLRSLQNDLKQLGPRLTIRSGKTEEEIDRLIDETGADALHGAFAISLSAQESTQHEPRLLRAVRIALPMVVG